MGFLSRFNPKDGVADFWQEFTKPNPYRWRILGVSALITFTLFYLFTKEGGVGPPPRPDVTYITSFAPGRSDAEILASNIENQRRKEQLQQILDEREERKRELYRTLGKVSGMDVEEIERQGAIERKAEEAEAQRVRDVMLGKVPAIPEDVRREAEERAKKSSEEAAQPESATTAE